MNYNVYKNDSDRAYHLSDRAIFLCTVTVLDSITVRSHSGLLPACKFSDSTGMYAAPVLPVQIQFCEASLSSQVWEAPGSSKVNMPPGTFEIETI